MKKCLLILLKCMVAVVAIYIAFRQVNWNELKNIQWNASFIWLLPAIIFFNTSQFISAYRLLQFYKLLDAPITYRFNLLLYYQGMFYNLFLPGGVGGDVYKVIVLKQRGNAVIPSSKATLLDRVTGLLVLLSVVVLLLNFMATPLPVYLIRIGSLAILPGFIIYWLIVRRFFLPFDTVITKTTLLSMITQGLQLLSFFCLLLCLHAPMPNLMQYAVLFLAGSVIAALPVSIGGIGTRELAMATGAAYLHVSTTIAVTGSVLFYVITAISAIAGWMGMSRKTVENNRA